VQQEAMGDRERTNEDLMAEVESLRARLGKAEGQLEAMRGLDGGKDRQHLALNILENVLEKERLMLGKAVEQAGDGIIVTDAEGVVEYVNSATQKISGFSREELLGEKLDLLQKDNPAYRHVLRVLGQEGQWKGRISSNRKDGTRCEVEAMVAAVRDDDGSTPNYIVIEHDVTGEMKLEQQVRQMQKMEALGRLAGGIAHDLNNILYPIIINTEMLLDEEGPGTAMHQPLRQILTAAYRQRDLVRQILAFSRRTEQKLKPVKIAPVIRESLKFLRASLPSTIEIRQDIHGEADMILGDPAQIHQVVMNLCSNGADALENQTGTIEVSLKHTYLEPARSRPDIKPGRYLQLTVSDTGRGMEHEVLEHIFEPFYTTKEASRGSGMGLAVVHGIVKGHRGTVSVESKPGKGTRFVVYLPLVDDLYREQVEAAATSDHKVRDKKQILLVDDEGIVLSSVQRALERMGFLVVPAGDGKSALDLFVMSPREFDLIITDQTMPHLTGAQLSEEVLRIRPDIPVILCTGFSEVITEAEAKDMGIRELLMKPATTRDLGDAVSRALKG
jgi:PAS domain S-box-containing protein